MKDDGDYAGGIQKRQKHGPWVTYHENGQLASKVTFLYGKRIRPMHYLTNEVRHQLSRCWKIHYKNKLDPVLSDDQGS